MSQKSFLDNKKITKEFSICWQGGGSTNIWKIPYVSLFLFLKASLSWTSIMFFAHLIVRSYFQESCLLFLVVIPTDFLQIIHPDYKSFQNFELQE